MFNLVNILLAHSSKSWWLPVKPKSKLLTQNPSQNPVKPRMIQAQGQNQENNNSKEGMSIRRALQEKKGENHL